MVLALDFGNTRIKYGLFDNNRFIDFGKIPYNQVEIDLFFDTLTDLKGGIYCTTSKISPHVQSKLNQYNIIGLSDFTNFGFKNNYLTPKTLGQDRIACLSAVSAYKSESAALIIDLGTCVTYDFLNSSLIFEGGNIAPGLHMRLKSMNDYTANLPLVSPEKDWALLGKNTQQAVLAGAMTGMLMEIKGFLSLFDPHSILYLTGGDAEYFYNHLENSIFAPNLVLEGLIKILQINS